MYNTEINLKFGSVSLIFYLPVEDLTKGMNIWELGKLSYTNFRTIFQTYMTQPCKGSMNPFSSDFFFPKSITSNFIGISDLYPLTCSFLYSYCNMICLCHRLTPLVITPRYGYWSQCKKSYFWWELRMQDLTSWRLSCFFLFLFQFSAIETEL